MFQPLCELKAFGWMESKRNLLKGKKFAKVCKDAIGKAFIKECSLNSDFFMTCNGSLNITDPHNGKTLTVEKSVLKHAAPYFDAKSPFNAFAFITYKVDSDEKGYLYVDLICSAMKGIGKLLLEQVDKLAVDINSTYNNDLNTAPVKYIKLSALPSEISYYTQKSPPFQYKRCNDPCKSPCNRPGYDKGEWNPQMHDDDTIKKIRRGWSREKQINDPCWKDIVKQVRTKKYLDRCNPDYGFYMKKCVKK